MKHYRLCQTAIAVLLSTLFLQTNTTLAFESQYINTINPHTKKLMESEFITNVSLETHKNQINIKESIDNTDKNQTQIELETLKLEKGRTFVVMSDRNLNSIASSGLPIEFTSVQKEYIASSEEPSEITFKGTVEKTGKPHFAGKNGSIKIKLEKIMIDNIIYPVDALISKIDDQKVMKNTLSKRPIYFDNIADYIDNGTIHSGWKDPCANHICTSTKPYLKPLIFLSAAAIGTTDLLLSPFSAITKKGNDVYIPKNTYFEIKLNKDMYILNI